MRLLVLAASVVIGAACGGHVGDPAGALDAGADAISATPRTPGSRGSPAVSPSQDDGDASSAFPAPTPISPVPGCPETYFTDRCHEPGHTCDVATATPCCGSCIEAVCCAARGQPCSNELGETCCAGLRCGNDCLCE